ncbi:MAG: hypothetical protein ACTSRP_28095 [Candidatus Helarchaeota archaeon]
MSIILTPNISDHAFFIHLALKALIGEKAVNKMFDKPVFIPASATDDGIARVVIGIKKCPLCEGLENKLKPLVGNADYLTVITSMGQAAVQNILEYVGEEYKVVVRETKCRCRGDEKGELTVFYYPIDKT